jgi:SEC-C motif
MTKPGRNDACHCGSGKKYKKCHGPKETAAAKGRVLMLVVGIAVAGAVVAGLISFTGQSGSSSGRVWDPTHGHFHDANGREVP